LLLIILLVITNVSNFGVVSGVQLSRNGKLRNIFIKISVLQTTSSAPYGIYSEYMASSKYKPGVSTSGRILGHFGAFGIIIYKVSSDNIERNGLITDNSLSLNLFNDGINNTSTRNLINYPPSSEYCDMNCLKQRYIDTTVSITQSEGITPLPTAGKDLENGKNYEISIDNNYFKTMDTPGTWLFEEGQRYSIGVFIFSDISDINRTNYTSNAVFSTFTFHEYLENIITSVSVSPTGGLS
jgi:hypothetical protein